MLFILFLILCLLSITFCFLKVYILIGSGKASRFIIYNDIYYRYSLLLSAITLHLIYIFTLSLPSMFLYQAKNLESCGPGDLREATAPSRRAAGEMQEFTVVPMRVRRWNLTGNRQDNLPVIFDSPVQFIEEQFHIYMMDICAMLQCLVIGDLALKTGQLVFFKNRQSLRMTTDNLADKHILVYHECPFQIKRR